MALKRYLVMAAIALLGAPTAASAQDILVAAASSLTNAFTELAIGFQQQHPGTKVLMSFAGSDALAQQVVHGAPIDVFASADSQAMDTAEQAGTIVPESRRDFARNEIVLIVPSDNPQNISGLADLAGGAIGRVAFGNPATVPAGRYTRAALEHAGSWDAVKKNEVLGQNVRQVLSYVARGEVDAGFVFATGAAAMADRVKVVTALTSPSPVLYPIALVERSGRHPQAAEFLSYVNSPAGQQVLQKHGFSAP